MIARFAGGGASSGALAFCGALVLLIAGSVQAALPADRLPPALERILDTRKAWRNLRVDWTLLDHVDLPTPRFYQSCLVEDGTLEIDLGDSDGVIARDSSGQPLDAIAGPLYSLAIDGELWVYADGAVSADVSEGFNPAGAADFRALGLSYHRHSGSLDAVFSGQESTADRRFTVARDGAIEVVSATDGDRVTTWCLDWNCGGIPTRVTLTENGVAIAESRSTLREHAGLWYPALVEFYRAGSDGALKPFEVIEVASIQINRPDLPAQLSPAFINIDAGVNTYVRQEGSGAPPVLRKWDGHQRVSLEEFDRREREGSLHPGPVFLENAQRAMERAQRRAAERQTDEPARSAPASAPAEHDALAALERLTGWAEYTRQFIERHDLDADQSQRAWLILAQCQERGLQVLRVRAPAIDSLELQKTRSELAETDYAEQRRRLLRPFIQIFDRQLVPRLDRLLTRTQRDRAAATQPLRPASP